MIRFLQKYSNKNIKILPKILVNHFVSKDSVTLNFTAKTNGLNSFHIKYIRLYSKDLLDQALQRAKRLFNYQETDNIKKIFNLTHKYAKTKKIVIGVAIHNNKSTILRCLKSILTQKDVKRKLDTKSIANSILKNNKNIKFVALTGGEPLLYKNDTV